MLSVVQFKMPSDREKIVAEFMSIAGCDNHDAQRYLEMHNYSLTHGLNQYFQEQSTEIRTKQKPRSNTVAHIPAGAIDKFFSDFATGPKIEPDGIERLCGILEIDPLDVIWLVISFRASAQSMGSFTLQEWKNAMTELGCPDVYSLKCKLVSIRESLLVNPDDFKQLYQFSFKFCLDPGHRNLSLDTAVALWKVLLPYSGWNLHEQWLDYVSSEDHHAKGRAVTKDVWTLLLSFAKSVPDAASRDGYDRDSGAWPIIYDEFYDHLRT